MVCQSCFHAHTFTDNDYAIAVDNFIRSLAGYCVATYVILPIGRAHLKRYLELAIDIMTTFC